MEGDVQQHEDDEEHDRQEQHETLACSELEFVLASPLERIAWRKRDLMLDRSPRVGHVTADVPCRGIDVDVPGQLRVFVANHRRTWRDGNMRDLPERQMDAVWRLDQHTLNRA